MRYLKRAGFVIVTTTLMFFIAYSGSVTYIPVAAAQSAGQESSADAAKRKRQEADAKREQEKKEADAAAERARKEAEAATERARKEAEAAARERARIEAEAAERAWKSFDTDMALVEGGPFMIGCTPGQQRDCDRDEQPMQEVTLNDFYIGKYEVTQAQWRLVMGNDPSNFKGDNLPVESVSWNDVQEFINRLNQRTGENYRLPTEAEWEYVARGGNQRRDTKYSGSNNIEEVAWYEKNSGGKTHPVGSKKANELGIHDMSGNVYEWVNDWYGNYSDGRLTNPKGPSSGSNRVIRGGSYSNNEWSARVSHRNDTDPGKRYKNLGFRLARRSKEAEAAAERARIEAEAAAERARVEREAAAVERARVEREAAAELRRQKAESAAAEIKQGKKRNLPFGNYKWRVLDVQDDKALLIAEDVIEMRPYNAQDKVVTWETCDLRKYLNGEFLQKFTAEERGKIAETPIRNADNLWYGEKGGNDTVDKIFLLSLEEVDRYFGNSGDYQNKMRKEYDKKGKFVTNRNGNYFSNANDIDRQAKFDNRACWWWLRSPGNFSSSAAFVNYDGNVHVGGSYVSGTSGGVRPAFWLNLKS